MIYLELFFVCILGIYIFYFYKTRKSKLKFIYGLPSIFLFLSLFFSFLGVFSYKININKNVNYESLNILFIIDVSKSMLAFDYSNKTRLDVAKEFVKNYVKNNDGKFGLSVFAGDVLNVIPPTKDKNLFLTFLDNVDEKSVLKGGTNFEEVLEDSILRFENTDNGGGVVILSDFEVLENKDNLLKSLNSSKFKEENIKIFGLGIGNENGNNIIEGYDFFGPVYKTDEFGKNVITKFDKDFFYKFIHLLNGQAYTIDSLNNLDNIYFNIPSNIINEETQTEIDISRYLAIISFFCFLVYIILFYYFDKNENKQKMVF